MPTTLPRHAITETPQIAAMLDDAAVVWPESADSRADLIRNLLAAGHEHVAGTAAAQHEHRVAAVREASGSMPWVWPLGSLKDEWLS